MATGFGPGLFPDLKREPRSHRRGILPYDEIRQLVAAGQLRAEQPIAEAQIQPASVDLRLGDAAFQVRASFLPGRKGRVLDAARTLITQELDIRDGAVLQKGAVYIVPLQESLDLPASTLAKANPKSTTGRLDVFARLIADGAEQFDRVPKGYLGDLFVEVAPRTFDVRVRRGTQLNQLRFLRGLPTNPDMSRKAARGGDDLVFDRHGEPLRATVLSGLWFSVDLRDCDRAPDHATERAGYADGEVIGWKARHNAPVIDLDRIGYYDPEDFWDRVRAPANRQLILEPGEFYILGSKERVRVPHAYAAEMVAYDPSMGEFRVHYAGFFDPGFGYGTGELRGTRAILEVRSHEVPYALQDGQKIGRLIYERLLAPPTKLYGVDAGSSYQFQEMGLSKQFRSERGAQAGDGADLLHPAAAR
jgi:dCTP deaminase